jgi:hypothetical protein
LKKFSSENFDCLLNSQKANSDKGCLGFKYVGPSIPSTSHIPLVTKGKFVFITSSYKGKNIVYDEMFEPKSGPLLRDNIYLDLSRLITIVKVGYISPNCYDQARFTNSFAQFASYLALFSNSLFFFFFWQESRNHTQESGSRQ